MSLGGGVVGEGDLPSSRPRSAQRIAAWWLTTSTSGVEDGRRLRLGLRAGLRSGVPARPRLRGDRVGVVGGGARRTASGVGGTSTTSEERQARQPRTPHGQPSIRNSRVYRFWMRRRAAQTAGAVMLTVEEAQHPLLYVAVALPRQPLVL